MRGRECGGGCGGPGGFWRPLESDVHEIIIQHREGIVALCRKHNVKYLEVFGSAAAGDLRDDSDVDFVVEFLPGVPLGFDDPYFALLKDLETLLGRRVDLVVGSAVTNPYFRRSLAATKVPVYAAA